MIQRLAKIFAVTGAALMLACAVIFTGAGISWGINGVALSIGILIALGIAGAVAVVWIAGAVEGLVIRFMLVWQSIRRINAETAKQEMASEFFQVLHPTAGAVAVDRNGRMIRLQPPVGQPGGQASPAPPAPPEPEEPDPEPLLPIINPLSRLLVIGGQGDGKTTLLKWLADDRVNKGHVVIADSHAAPDTWPSYCQVAGIGRNYPEIEATINYICDELDNRYKLRATGAKKHFDPITLIIDELFVLHQFLNLGTQFKSLLAESRKVNIGLIMAGQSDRANALGLSGNKDLIAGFEAVVYLDRDDSGRYVAEVKTGKRSRLCLHPGPYRGRSGSSGRRPDPEWLSGTHRDTATRGTRPKNNGFRADSGPVSGVSPVYRVPMAAHGADGQDAEIIDLYRRGKSLREICRQVIGSAGGRQAKKVKTILATHGLI